MNRVYSGFDSAWTDRNQGAISSIIESGGQLSLLGPVLTGFEQALKILDEHRGTAEYQLLAIDQPIIVENPSHMRPVEYAVGSLLGKMGGAVQPANRGKMDMFGDDAPIWGFLQSYGGLCDPVTAVEGRNGRFVIEVFPAVGNLGLFPRFLKRGKAPKYNPTRRKTFSIEDWRLLCNDIGDMFDRFGIVHGKETCARFADIISPKKAEQDCVDSMICALHALLWGKKGYEASVVIGDISTGYMVIPASSELARMLKAGATKRSVHCSNLSS